MQPESKSGQYGKLLEDGVEKDAAACSCCGVMKVLWNYSIGGVLDVTGYLWRWTTTASLWAFASGNAGNEKGGIANGVCLLSMIAKTFNDAKGLVKHIRGKEAYSDDVKNLFFDVMIDAALIALTCTGFGYALETELVFQRRLAAILFCFGSMFDLGRMDKLDYARFMQDFTVAAGAALAALAQKGNESDLEYMWVPTVVYAEESIRNAIKDIWSKCCKHEKEEDLSLPMHESPRI